MTPVWYLFEDDRFYFESFSGSRKVANLRREPAASVIVDGRMPGREQWVSASGPTEVVSGEEARSMNARIRQRYLTPQAIGDARIEPVLSAADDVSIRLTPTCWRSWTARETDERFFGGILGETPQRWFLPVDV